MMIPDLTQPLWFLIAALVVFLVVFLRYILIAGFFYCYFYLWYPDKWKEQKISRNVYNRRQFRRETGWSFVTTIIFAFTGAAAILLWQKGFIKIYANAQDYPLIWLPLSLVIALLLHETYYYWLHRWMHRPAIFKWFHKVHHESNITSPWTAFSFHPLEGFLQAIFFPLLLMVLPMHLYVLLVQLTLMTFSSVINHLDIEIYQGRIGRYFIGKWLIGASHHSLHHKQFKYNYGLYFTFWDKWKRTESPDFEKVFFDKTSTLDKS